jgi:hypothetical protein
MDAPLRPLFLFVISGGNTQSSQFFVETTQMPTKQDRRRDEEVLGDDLLYGAEAIAKFLKRKPRWVYHPRPRPRWRDASRLEGQAHKASH